MAIWAAPISSGAELNLIPDIVMDVWRDWLEKKGDSGRFRGRVWPVKGAG